MEMVGIQIKLLWKGNKGSWFWVGKNQDQKKWRICVGAVDTLVFVLRFEVGMEKKM